MAVTSPVGDVKIVSLISTFVPNTLTLKKSSSKASLSGNGFIYRLFGNSVLNFRVICHSLTSSLGSLLRRLDEKSGPTAGQGERGRWVRGWYLRTANLVTLRTRAAIDHCDSLV